jgi:hypothetical protein
MAWTDRLGDWWQQELESADADPYRMHFFNPFDRGARILLDESAPFEAPGGGAP